MKEKYTFIGVIIVAMIAVGFIAYRSVYRDGVKQDQDNFPISTPFVISPTIDSGDAIDAEGIKTSSVPSAIDRRDGIVGTVDANTFIVAYTDTGFAPVSLSITADTTVVFKNNSNALMWVASAPHPTHTDYSEFDARRGYASGESYSFTFDRAGIWKYHNHLYPAHFGFIVVAE